MKRYIKSSYIPNKYDEKQRQNIDKMVGDRQITLNELYQRDKDSGMDEHIFFYENTKGYYHIMMPQREKLGDREWYTVIDYLWQPNGMLKETNRTGEYETLDECYDYLLEISK